MSEVTAEGGRSEKLHKAVSFRFFRRLGKEGREAKHDIHIYYSFLSYSCDSPPCYLSAVLVLCLYTPNVRQV